MAGSRLGERLTRRQRQVLDLIAEGRTNFEIAQALGISLDGAKWHVREVLTRMGVDSREEAADAWRSPGRPMARTRGVLASLGHLGWLRIAGAGAAVVGAAAVAGALYIHSGDSPTTPDGQAPAPTTTPASRTDDLSPRSDIPIVDEVIKAIAAHDPAEVNRLVVARPERCSYEFDGSTNALQCPPAQSGPNGLLIDTKRGLDNGKAVREGDLEILLRRIVPEIRFLHGAAVVQSDAFDAFFGPWKYEVYAYGGASGWTVFLVDDQGIVGVVCGGGFSVSDRANAVPEDDWLVAPYSLARIVAASDLYVLGRDAEIRFEIEMPLACFRKPLAVQLFGLPDPGVSGGIQVINEPGFNSELRISAAVQGNVLFRLPATASSPLLVRPGLRASCLSDIAVGGQFQLGLLAPPADADIAIIEYSGKALDLSRGTGLGTVGEFLAPLRATVNGVPCQTIDTADRSRRNARGNIEFRIGTPDQPAECRSPGTPIVFLFPSSVAAGLANKPLFEKPIFVPGAIQIVRNIGPEGIAD